MKNLPQIIDEVNSIKNSVLGAMGMLKAGQIMELNNVEMRVKDVCGLIQKLPANDRKTVQPHLMALLDDMDKYYEEMKSRHGELMEQIKQLNPNRQAVHAYNKASNIKNTTGED
ncbi:MAG: hypothetical protein EYC62_01470 [Alphaproteobacteria bacterium]|nr:MAG: hypothetical protein EYC62_01470 [Alphaproteobacteria bacterium]